MMTSLDNQEPRESSLTRVGDVLSMGLENPGGRSSEIPWATEMKDEECTCSSCGSKFQGQVTKYLRIIPPREIRSRECPSCRQARVEEGQRLEAQEIELRRVALREKWRREWGIPWGLKCSQFKDFEVEPQIDTDQRKTVRLCREYADKFNLDNAQGMPSLLLSSDVPGVGKTTLMICIANHIIDNWLGNPDATICPIRFESGPSLVRRIRATYNIPAEDSHHEREEQVYAQMRGVKLLLLDDVGKEQPHSYRFTQEIYWYIIDERVKAGLPVVVSSRLPMTGPGSMEALMTVDAVDRLYGMCQGQAVDMGGTSYRRRHKIA